MSFFSFSLSDWSSCEQVWKECAKTNTACGCIASPTIWTILFAVGVSIIGSCIIYWYIKLKEVKQNDKIQNNR